MSSVFTLGISELSFQSSLMSMPGIYWISSDRLIDAELLAKQVFSVLPRATSTALITNEKGAEFLHEAPLLMEVEEVLLLHLPISKADLQFFSLDLSRSLKGSNWFIVVMIDMKIWLDSSGENLQKWLEQINSWSKQQQSTLLILSYGSKTNLSQTELKAHYRNLDGLADLEGQDQQTAKYTIFWWSNQETVIAHQKWLLKQTPQGWVAQPHSSSDDTLSLQEDNLYLAEKNVLEGAPPLSDNWQLVASNNELVAQAKNMRNVTLILAYSKNESLEVLAKAIYTLRSQGGKQLKIVVREVNKSLRYSEEQLLLICGANLVVPYPTSLSKFLTVLESVRGQEFTRPLPQKLDELFAALQPLKIKGYINLHNFCESVISIIDNSLIPKDQKGVLVGLRPVPSLQLGQALALCQVRRLGDIVTVTKTRIYLFLFQCRISDIEIALGSIFRLPVNEIFSNYMLWYQDQQIAAKIKRLGLSQDLLIQPMPVSKSGHKDNKMQENLKHIPSELNLDDE